MDGPVGDPLKGTVRAGFSAAEAPDAGPQAGDGHADNSADHHRLAQQMMPPTQRREQQH
ncbi:MAG: hypothetical protein Q7T21_01215 [Gallionella sp.]|nr:hypothetical protein [Gallionella sp.]